MPNSNGFLRTGHALFISGLLLFAGVKAIGTGEPGPDESRQEQMSGIDAIHPASCQRA